jgi:hypothetical protein
MAAEEVTAEIESPGKGWVKNSGRRPRAKRVRVVLANGLEPAYDSQWNPMSPTGWLSETTRWTLTGDPFDVAWYRPLS